MLCATGLFRDFEFSKFDFTDGVLFFVALRYQKPLPSSARGLVLKRTGWFGELALIRAGWFDMLSGADIKSALLEFSSER